MVNSIPYSAVEYLLARHGPSELTCGSCEAHEDSGSLLMWLEVGKHYPVHKIGDIRTEGIVTFHFWSPGRWTAMVEVVRSGHHVHGDEADAKSTE